MAVKKLAKKITKPKSKAVKKPTTTKGKSTTVPTKKTAKKRKATTSRAKAGVDFPVGSDMAVVFEEVCQGGSSRRDVLERIRQRFDGKTTASGNPKPASTILNQVVTRAKNAGFEIEETWRVVPTKTTSTVKPSKVDGKPKGKAVKKPGLKGKKTKKG